MAAVEMGEIEEIHSKEEDGIILNGDVTNETDSNDNKTVEEENDDEEDENEEEPMQVDDDDEENHEIEDDEGTIENSIEGEEDEEEEEDNENSLEIDNLRTNNEEKDEEDDNENKLIELDNSKEDTSVEDIEMKEDDEVVDDDDDVVDDEEEEIEEENEEDTINIDENNKNKIEDEIHEIDDGDDEDEDDLIEETHSVVSNNNSNKTCTETIELNDSGEGEGDTDVMIIEDGGSKENGITINRRKSEDPEIIELDSTTPTKNNKSIKKISSASSSLSGPTRRSVRNIHKQQRSYIESDKEEETTTPQTSEESDVEEVLPEDPLALGDNLNNDHNRKLKSTNSSSTIVVKDTKRLVEIAAKSNNLNSGKKEPTLVIIDTNSILSGRGPVPMSSSKSNSINSPVSTTYPTLLPMALPAQGMYPPNMRATITPIPINTSVTSTTKSSHHSSLLSSSSSSSPSSSSSSANASLAPVLPTLTDDMFVVEAPSFIVPYVYEKPPVNDFKEFVKTIKDEIIKLQKQLKNEENKKDKENKDKNDVSSSTSGGGGSTVIDDDDDIEEVESDDLKKFSDDFESTKNYSYFDSPLGKFFIDIGCNLVEEFVQSDLLKQQKRKRDREGGQNATTNKTIHSLLKNLEFSKENNEPFKMQMKKCEFCHFKTESLLTMAHHLEKPHMKNYVYKCNFCSYEIRSPHDILFHMEAEHAVRGRLERAPAFHQCPNCPFEDNQKGKLSRHLVACTRKFKPDRNLEPPIDFEPPAKIPRVPKSRQGLNVSAYQAMKNNSQLQFLTKMQMLNANQHAMNRGRGRPTLGNPVKGQQLLRPSGMVYKQTVGGGSVLVPTNYQLSGNQVYQVLGGQELGGRLGHPGHMAFVPNIPSASSTVTIQQQHQLQNQSKNKNVHQPSISITPLPRAASSSNSSQISSKPGDTNSKNSFVICEICDGYIKDLEQLRNHMQWIHKVKIHPKMIYNRPPLNCQKCQFRFFTDQGLERHLLGSHGLVTSSMQDAANKSKDAGRCPVCGRVYQWKLLNHVARDHNMTLKPAHLSYKCTVCTATFGMYKQFENHVYSAHSVVAKRVMDKKNPSSSSNSNKSEQLIKPLKINDEITIIPQPAKSSNGAGTSKEGSPSSSTGSRNSTPSTSKNNNSTSNSCSEPLSNGAN